MKKLTYYGDKYKTLMMKKVLDWMEENDMYADFGDVIIIFSKENDEVFFIGTLGEVLNFIEHYNQNFRKELPWKS